jgi:hypothetical protein
MKTSVRIGLAILIAVSLVSCAEQGGLKAGTATSKSLLKLIPATARVVFMVDVHRSLAADTVQNALKDERTKQKYDEFTKMAGLDPTKDVYFLALTMAGTPGSKNQQGAVVINLRYNKDNLLAKIKGLVTNLREEIYNGVTIYNGPGAPKAEGHVPAGAFLDDSNIVLGSAQSVRAVIDVYQKRADSVDKSPEMKKLLKAVNASANVWGAVAIPQEMVKQAAEKNPMLKDLVGLTGLTLSFDYANRSLIVEIQGLGGTKEQNKSLAEKLTALKGMGTLFAAKQPVLGDLINTIEISSGTDNVKIYASVPAELLDKAQKMAQERLGGLMSVKPQAPPTDGKKGEKKEGPVIKK